MCMASLCVYSAEVQPHIFESLSMEGWKLPQHFIFPALLRSWKLLETTTSRARLLLGKVSYILLLVYEPIPQSGTINIRYNPLQFVAHASRFGARNRDVVLELPLYCGEEWPKCGLWGFPPPSSQPPPPNLMWKFVAAKSFYVWFWTHFENGSRRMWRTLVILDAKM